MAQQRLSISRAEDDLRFYIDGCLQFSSQDEHIYHETLVHPAAGILERRLEGPWRALILGGGDGLALREVLRCRRCSAVELVDHDPEVLERAKTAFSEINRRAFEDSRVTVHIEDARERIQRSTQQYDLIIADFTFPNTHACAGLFTTSFFRLVKERLHSHGLFSLNTVSPTRHTVAYWSIYKTLGEVGMAPRPLQVTIPSFAAHGYGQWGFFAASPEAIRSRELRDWEPAAPTRFMLKEQLLDSLRFPAEAAWTGFQLGSALKAPVDLLGLMDLPLSIQVSSGAIIDFSRDDALEQIHRIARRGGLPIRLDSEWTAKAVAILRSMDLDRLFDEVGSQIGQLSESLQDQFWKLRSELPRLLKERALNLEKAGQLVCMLMLVILLINLAYPDSSYAKGSSSSGDGTPVEICVFSPVQPTPFHIRNLQDAHLSYAVNMKGATFARQRVAAEASSNGASRLEELFYSVTDELFLTQSGQVFSCSLKLPTYYYRVTPERITLIRELTNEAVMAFAPDDDIVRSLLENGALQLKALEKTLEDYRKWNDWTSPMTAVSDGIEKECRELVRLHEIHSALTSALTWLRNSRPADPPPRVTVYKLAPGVYVSAAGVLLSTAEKGWGLYRWGKASNTLDLPVLESTREMDSFLTDALSMGQGLDPKALQLLDELKYNQMRGAVSR